MPKAFKIVLLLIALIFLSALSFGAGFEVSRSFPALSPSAASSPDAPPKVDTLGEVWRYLNRDYVEKDKLDSNKLGEGAIKGMLEALGDPYTSYLPPEHFKMERESFEGKFEGIGAQVALQDKQLVVVAPIADSPAEKAGIKAGDKILQVNGEPTAKMTLSEAVLKIRGPKGTKVKLLILHKDETKPVEIEIVRAEIKLESVRYKMLENTGYVRITYFSQTTDRELATALRNLRSQRAQNLILDLRTNPGGLLTEVVDVASQFLDGGVVLYEVHSDGSRKTWTARSGGLATDLPLVVLVDSHSASGSEVLAGALQDRKRALIVGKKTFGKGSVNSLRPLSDGGGLYLTIARWVTPQGRLIEGKGLEPDQELELTGDALVQWAADYLKGKKPPA